MSCINGDISREVIKDLALNEIWDAAKKYEEYQKVTDMIEQKADMMNVKTLSKSLVQEYIGHGIERMLLIEKDDVKIILKDQTRIMVPKAMREVLLQREHQSQSGKKQIEQQHQSKIFLAGN